MLLGAVALAVAAGKSGRKTAVACRRGQGASHAAMVRRGCARLATSSEESRTRR